MSTATGVRLPDELLQIAKCPLRLRQSQSVPSIDSGPARLSLRLRVPKNLWQRRACKCLRLYVCNVVRYAAQKQMFLAVTSRKDCRADQRKSIWTLWPVSFAQLHKLGNPQRVLFDVLVGLT